MYLYYTYYDQTNKYYKNIIIIYNKPPEDLKSLTQQINLKSPSSYTDIILKQQIVVLIGVFIH